MTAPVKSGAARAPHAPAEAAKRRSKPRSRKSTVSERDLAMLESELARLLQDEPAPSLAGPGGEDEPALSRAMAPHMAPGGPAGKRLDEFLRDVKHLTGAESAAGNDRARNTQFPQAAANDSDPTAPERLDWRTRALRPEPVPWIERPERASRLMRATRFAAAVFSAVALIGVGALLAFLAISGERPATLTAKDTMQAVQATLITLASPERDDAPAVTGSIGEKQDTSRIPSDLPAPALGAGSVQPVNAQTQPRPAEAAQSAEAPLVKRVVTTRIPVETLASEAAPSPQEPAAQAETAVVAAVDSSGTPAEAARNAAVEQAKPTRSAAVTMHVNMRARPASDAAVVAVVPEGKQVEVKDCAQWCQVVYEGRQGFVFRKFVSGQ
ncbi:MAG: SH3 domain-containing protein [Bradyrhizobiaceae bacterium]|nr:SH3 domain-containing protein [Bradyrhizobiaceae bacterium]